VNIFTERHFRSSGYIFLAGGAILLKVVIVLMLTNYFPGTFASPSVTQYFWGISGSPLDETARYSREFSEQRGQQIKGESLLLMPDSFLSLLQQKLNRPWATAVLVVPFVILFLPRQFLPVHPLADDDPLLS